MPDNAAIALVFDFEHIFEVAIKALFIANAIKAFTSQMTASTGNAAQDAALVAAGWDIIDFQKDRPRVEITFTPGSGAQQWNNKTFTGSVTGYNPTGEIPVETSWKGQIKLDLITPADMQIHTAYRNFVRFLMHTQLTTLNNTALTLHRIQSFYHDAGTTPVLKPETGLFQTSMLYDLDFSIQDDAWATLAN